MDGNMTDIKLAKASSSMLDLTSGTPLSTLATSTGQNEPDKLGVPKKWPELVEKIRFFYLRDPVTSTVVDKLTDITVNGIYNNRGDISDNIFDVYESFVDALEDFLKHITREYLLSGLVIPEVIWFSKEFKTEDPHSLVNLEDTEAYTVPQGFWLRDPATVEAIKTPIPNRIVYLVKITDDLKHFIETGGEYKNGMKDVTTYKLLVEQYPAFVDAVRNGKEDYFQLDPMIVLRRAPLAGESYPTPYLLKILESLSYKRKLRKMDYAVAARVISAIQLIKMGDKDFPLTEGDEDQLEDLKTQMLWRGQADNVERVFQLFGNHTLTIEWIYPDTKTLLDSGKYEAVNDDIMFGLGFPRILLTGETERSFTSNPEFAMFSPSETIEGIRKELMKFVRVLYKEVADRNNFSEFPRLEFAPLRLYDLEKMSNVSKDLYEKGLLSRTSYLELGDRDFEDELHNIVRERDLLKEYDVPEYAPQPFTPQPQTPGSTPNTPDEENEDA